MGVMRKGKKMMPSRMLNGRVRLPRMYPKMALAWSRHAIVAAKIKISVV